MSDLARDPLAYRLLVAFVGGPPGWAPTDEAFRDFPNESVKAAWRRVADVIGEEIAVGVKATQPASAPYEAKPSADLRERVARIVDESAMKADRYGNRLWPAAAKKTLAKASAILALLPSTVSP